MFERVVRVIGLSEPEAYFNPIKHIDLFMKKVNSLKES